MEMSWMREVAWWRRLSWWRCLGGWSERVVEDLGSQVARNLQNLNKQQKGGLDKGRESCQLFWKGNQTCEGVGSNF